MTTPQRHWFPLTGEQPPSTDARDAAALVGHRATPVDPLSGPNIALGGRLVLMDDAFQVLPMNDDLTRSQQKVANRFRTQGLVPMDIKVSDIVWRAGV